MKTTLFLLVDFVLFLFLMIIETESAYSTNVNKKDNLFLIENNSTISFPAFSTTVPKSKTQYDLISFGTDEKIITGEIINSMDNDFFKNEEFEKFIYKIDFPQYIDPNTKATSRTDAVVSQVLIDGLVGGSVAVLFYFLTDVNKRGNIWPWIGVGAIIGVSWDVLF